MSLGVTVVVCTYNGAALLPDTIRYIAQQRVHAHIPWEVIIVDNASTDNTSAVVREEWEKYSNPVPFSLLHQPIQGLTYARKLALASSQFDFVLFCDDDNWLDPEYVNIVFDVMMQNPSIGVLGGKGELVYEQEPPSWIALLSWFANGPQAEKSGKVSRNVVYGAGCVLRKKAFETIMEAGFNPMLTDRIATSLSSGGDYELCYSIALAGYDIWYDERLRFKHFMPKIRLNWDYHKRFIEESSNSFEVLIAYQIVINNNSKNLMSFNWRIIRLAVYLLKHLFISSYHNFALTPASDNRKINDLKRMALKRRLSVFKKYFAIRNNFLIISKLKRNRVLALHSQNESNTFMQEGQLPIKLQLALINKKEQELI